nr:MAG TPA: hypothetical protein [Caudoviricetes sp.]
MEAEARVARVALLVEQRKLLCLRLKSTRMSTYSPGAKDLLAVVTGHLTLVAKHISSTELNQKPLKKPRRKHKKKDKGE